MQIRLDGNRRLLPESKLQSIRTNLIIITIMPLTLPEGYRNVLENVENTEKAIKYVKDMFQENLSAQLALLRVTAPMMVLSGTGINDDLNSVERPVSGEVEKAETGADGCGARQGYLHGYERAAA